MKKIVQITVLSLGMLSVMGCNTINNQDIGMVTGGVAGGLLGSQFGGGTGKLVAIGVGTLAGALIGGAIGKSMDQTDKLKAEQAIERTPTGATSTWHNPDTGNNYSVKPVKTYKRKGIPCREYTMTANIGGKMEQVHGKACRQADGSWKTQS